MERSLPAVVVFDIGGVLSAPEGGVPELSAALGLTPETFAPAYWRHRDAYDRGSAAEEYWGAVGEDLGLTWTSEQWSRLDRIDAQRWSDPAPAPGELLGRVQASGVATAILSNAPASMAAAVRAGGWSARFEQRFFSCDLGAAKPEPTVYVAVEEAFGVRGDDLVFLDDRPVNVEAAAQRGWRAHLWSGPVAAQAFLLDCGLPLGPA